MQPQHVVLVGAGPTGLIAAETLVAAGHPVDVYDAMPSVGRKFLLAGIGGLNLTHSENFERFCSRFTSSEGQADALQSALQQFTPTALQDWAAGLGITTFVGSSGRVFPTDMKAAPLLRAWLHRLRHQGVRFHMRHRWLGWDSSGALLVQATHPDAAGSPPLQLQPAATVLALGGASWQRLGSDGAWWPLLQARGVPLAPLQPSNCGFDVAWSEHLRQRFAGAPLKGVALHFEGWQQNGECVLTNTGIEGSLVYAASSRLRERINTAGRATFTLDLLPNRSLQWVETEVAHPRGPRSLATHLKARLNLQGAKAALIWERVSKADQADPQRLSAAIKALPIEVLAPRPIDEAISTAGGVAFSGLDEHGMLRALPGVFCAGEMLDWEAPTGGYLLNACLASGRAAGQGAAAWLAATHKAAA